MAGGGGGGLDSSRSERIGGDFIIIASRAVISKPGELVSAGMIVSDCAIGGADAGGAGFAFGGGGGATLGAASGVLRISTGIGFGCFLIIGLTRWGLTTDGRTGCVQSRRGVASGASGSCSNGATGGRGSSVCFTGTGSVVGCRVKYHRAKTAAPPIMTSSRMIKTTLEFDFAGADVNSLRCNRVKMS